MERKKIISQGSLKEFENDGDYYDRYYLPARGLVLPGDYYLLPDFPDLKAYSQHYNYILSQLSIPPRNIIEVPDTKYLLDLAILENLTLLKKNIPKKGIYCVYPYATTAETNLWIQNLKNEGYNISAAFPEKKYFDNLRHPSHRGGWGRWIKEPDIMSFPEIYNLPYPISWIGQGLSQIIEAYQKVVELSESNEVFFKPIFSAGGFTLAKINSIDELKTHYQKIKNKGALSFEGEEIPVEIQAFVNDIAGFYSIQYMENGNLFTPRGLCHQIIENNQWQGNVFNGEHPDENLLLIWEKFKNAYKNLGENFGWGGLDLVKKTDGSWIILEHNGLRITGAHPAILLAKRLQVVNQPFATKKSPGEINCDLLTLWEILNNENLAFDLNTKKGIIPIVWFPGSGMLWATGENPYQILDKAYNLLLKENYVKS